MTALEAKKEILKDTSIKRVSLNFINESNKISESESVSRKDALKNLSDAIIWDDYDIDTYRLSERTLIISYRVA